MLVTGIAGGSGSGKTTIVNALLSAFKIGDISVISQDAYYFNKSHLSPEEKKKINFDHPASIEWKLLLEHIDLLKKGKAVRMPVYDYASCTRQKNTILIKPAGILIVEGILIYTQALLIEKIDLKVFVDVTEKDRLHRKIRRDVKERGRTTKEAEKHFYDFVEPMHQEFIEPSKKFADFIISRGGKNKKDVDRLIEMIKKLIH